MRCKTVFYIVVIVIVIVSSFVITNGQYKTKSIHPDAGLSVLQLIEKYGFPLERHFVTTKDGYILEWHRIPHGRHNKEYKDLNVPVLLMHGLMSSSADFVNFGENSLGFILADSGYDVWLGNARGNYWSRNHTTLNPDNSKRYWMFSWHEIGVYDLPASIDYILKLKQQEKLFYIGHSQGATSFFVTASLFPEYNDKIRLMSALAPGSYTKHIGSPVLQFASSIQYELEALSHMFGMYEMLPRSQLNEILSQQICTKETNLEGLCGNILSFSVGYDPEQFNNSMMSVITTNAPSGSSSRQYLHYGQGIRDGHFRQYDFGKKENLKKYGKRFPPDYPLGNVTAPVAIYYGANDLLVSITDLKRLARELGNTVRLHLVENQKFNHIDFLWANDVRRLVYDHVLELMTKY